MWIGNHICSIYLCIENIEYRWPNHVSNMCEILSWAFFWGDYYNEWRVNRICIEKISNIYAVINIEISDKAFTDIFHFRFHSLFSYIRILYIEPYMWLSSRLYNADIIGGLGRYQYYNSGAMMILNIITAGSMTISIL